MVRHSPEWQLFTTLADQEIGVPYAARPKWYATLPSGISAKDADQEIGVPYAASPKMVRPRCALHAVYRNEGNSPEWQLFTTLADQEIGVPTLRNNR